MSNVYLHIWHIPHKLIETALENYHIPGKIATIVKEYLERIHLRFRVGDNVTSWQRLEKGNSNRVYHICRPFRDGNETLDRDKKKRDQRTKDQVRH